MKKESTFECPRNFKKLNFIFLFLISCLSFAQGHSSLSKVDLTAHRWESNLIIDGLAIGDTMKLHSSKRKGSLVLRPRGSFKFKDLKVRRHKAPKEIFREGIQWSWKQSRLTLETRQKVFVFKLIHAQKGQISFVTEQILIKAGLEEYSPAAAETQSDSIQSGPCRLNSERFLINSKKLPAYYHIRDQFGETVLHADLLPNTANRIDYSALKSGIYFFEVYNQTGLIWHDRFIKGSD